MTSIKTFTTALTATALVTGIGLAVAQTDSAPQPAEPLMAPAPTSEDSPADPNAVPQTNTATTATTQQQAVDATANTTPPVNNNTAVLSSRDPNVRINGDMTTRSGMDTSTPTAQDSTSTTPPAYDTGRTEPAARADRN